MQDNLLNLFLFQELRCKVQLCLYLNTTSMLNMLFLINYHMMPMTWNSDKAKQKWKKRFGEYKYNMLLDFNKCDKMR